MRVVCTATEVEVMEIDRKCDGTCGCIGCEDCADQDLGLVICAECGHAVAEKEVVR